MSWAEDPPPGSATGPAGLGYHELHRGGRRGVWRPILGVLILVVGLFLVAPLAWQLVYAGYLLGSGEPVIDGLTRALDLDDPTPLGLAYLNLTLASAIPLTWFVTRVLHGLRPAWLTSVLPRMRWRYFAVCLGLSLLALLATVIVSAFTPAAQSGAEVSGTLNDFTATTRDFLLVVLLLTPLQAAGEEYAFRGYLTQAFGGIVRGRAGTVLAVVGPALLFALAHGSQSAPIFVDRLAFGLVAGVLVLRTGGLEAAVAMHVLNNFLAFGLALAFTDMGTALNPTGGSWWSLPGTLAQSLVYLWLATTVAARMGLARTAEPSVLEASRGRV